MANQLILEGNFDPKIHTYKKGCDAFGNPIELPEGYRFLGKIKDSEWDKIQKGDLHFDIYGGWTDGHGDFCNGTYYYIHQEGRWMAWARKIDNQ